MIPPTSNPKRCDRCSSAIVLGPFDRPSVIEIWVDTDRPETFESEVRSLCTACESDLLDWIDDGEIDHSDAVDLPRALTPADHIKAVGEEFIEFADRLNENLDSKEARDD